MYTIICIYTPLHDTVLHYYYVTYTVVGFQHCVYVYTYTVYDREDSNVLLLYLLMAGVGIVTAARG